MSTLTSKDIVTKRSSTQVSQAPGGNSTFSLSYDEPAADTEPVENEEEVTEETDGKPAVTPNIAQNYKANQQRGTTSSIFDNSGPTPSQTVRPSKTQQSSIEFGASAPPSTSSRPSKTSQSSIEFGGAEPPRAAPRVTPTTQSHVLSNAAPAPPSPSPKTTNKSLMSTLSLSSDPAPSSAPTTNRHRQPPGGNTSVVLG